MQFRTTCCCLFPFQIQEETLSLKAGDRILLCSDGLYKQVPENDLVTHIQANLGEPDKLLEFLVKQASTAEHSDNITVVYVEIEE